MGEDADSYTQAEIVRLLTRLDTNINSLSEDVKRLEQNYVTRAEWTLWKEGNDREMKQVKESIAPVKVPGTQIAAVIISAVVGVGSLLTAAIVLITNIGG